MKNTLRALKSQWGLAMDEAILAAAMVTSFGVFVGVNVPWGNLLTDSTQVVAEVARIEKANKAFYMKNKLWPHQTTNGDWKMNVAALVSPEAMRYPYNIMTHFTNYMPEYQTNATELRHNLGEGGSIMQRPVTVAGAEYLEIIFERVPLREARKVDTEIDGSYDPEEGKVQLIFDENEGYVNLHYRANSIRI